MKNYKNYTVQELFELFDKLTAFTEENPNSKLNPSEVIANLEQCDNENAEKLKNRLLLLGPKGHGKISEKDAKLLIESLNLISLDKDKVSNKITDLRKDDNITVSDNTTKLN